MKKIMKFLAVLPLGIALLSPLSALADDHDHDHDHDRDHEHRYYDKEHKDYHQWSNNEDRAWHRYWEDRHHDAVNWDRAKDEQRRDYWRWRHEHPDSVLFQVNVR